MNRDQSSKLSAPARRVARTILNGYESYFAEYQNVTLGAKRRFEKADWRGVHEASKERIDLYKNMIGRVSRLVGEVTSRDLADLGLWCDAREAYGQLIAGHTNYEIAETFFNSIYCRVHDHSAIHDQYAFVTSSQPTDLRPLPDYSIYVRYDMHDGLVSLVADVLDDFAFTVPWENRRRDVVNIVERLERELLPMLDCPLEELRVEMLESVFYRNKAAYIVGRAVHRDGVIPLILACLNNEKGGIYIDSVIHDQDGASIIFSFARSYFMVDAPVPSRYVRFLGSLMPQKTVAELYNSIGFSKHGKTEFHRELVTHMRASDDLYTIAPGIRGMVMTVFTLPSYSVVFKVIKDRFDPPKQVTEEVVREKYRFVSRSDRAGRMADTQEYKNLLFERDRFAPELVEELQRVAPSKIWMDEKWIMVRHLYVERRMVPLNLYLRDASDAEILDAMDEYGNAIKQMAAANVFPGDMLLKNFGVTRHGRVVFYDYDEICELTECNFRRIPEPRDDSEAMSAGPWYTVGEYDVFPEEFRLFFSGNPRAREAFEAQHADLYDHRYWQRMQDAIKAGYIFDTFPYRRRARFDREESGLSITYDMSIRAADIPLQDVAAT